MGVLTRYRAYSEAEVTSSVVKGGLIQCPIDNAQRPTGCN